MAHRAATLCLVGWFCFFSLPSTAGSEACFPWKRLKEGDIGIDVQCLARNPSPFDGAIKLLAAERQGKVDTQKSDAAFALGKLYQRLGLPEQAQAVADGISPGWYRENYDRFWLEQARTWLRHDRPQEAEQALRQWKLPSYSELREQRLSLLTLSLLEQGKNAEAARVLEPNNGFPRRDLIGHYNYAVALVRRGDTGKGMALLDEIGVIEAGDNGHIQAVRDRANLQLGWMWLRMRKGGTARPIFKRISLEGLHSEKALLGLGWAELAPDAGLQTVSFDRTLFCPDIKNPPHNTHIALFYTKSIANCEPGKAYPFTMVHEFAYEPAAKGRKVYINALKYWTELVKRDTANPAVQEGLLATAYAFHQYGAREDAVRAYRQALDGYATERRRLERLERRLRMPESDPLTVIDRPAFQAYLVDLRTSRAFHRQARVLRLLDRMHARLSSVEAEVDDILAKRESPKRKQLVEMRQRIPVLQQRLTALRSSMRDTLRGDLLGAVTEQHERLARYREQATSGLAQIYE